MIHPSFVAMLFLCLGPVFCLHHEIVPVEWEAGSVRWSSAWYGQPCHEVQPPDGRSLCIYCANEKPASARFVFTPDWFQTFQCRWECPAGLMGPGCGLSSAGVAGALCVAGMLVGCGACRWARLAELKEVSRAPFSIPHFAPVTRRLQEPAVVLAAADPIAARVNDAISFKEGALHEIRIKLL